jgi:hypothetical protein
MFFIIVGILMIAGAVIVPRFGLRFYRIRSREELPVTLKTRLEFAILGLVLILTGIWDMNSK